MKYEMNNDRLREAISTTHNMLKCFDHTRRERAMLCEHLHALLEYQRGRALDLVDELE